MICGRCGTKNSKGDKFCSDCGTKLGFQEQPEFESKIPTDPTAKTDFLIQNLEAPDKHTRWLAAEKLGELKHKAAVPALMERLKGAGDTDFQKWNILNVLGEIGDPAAIEAIGPYLKSDDHFIRWLAVSSLGKIGGKEVFDKILPFLTDHDDMVRKQVIQILHEIDSTGAKPHLDRYRSKATKVEKTLIDSLYPKAS